MVDSSAVKQYLLDLQDRICQQLQDLEPSVQFREDA